MAGCLSSHVHSTHHVVGEIHRDYFFIGCRKLISNPAVDDGRKFRKNRSRRANAQPMVALFVVLRTNPKRYDSSRVLAVMLTTSGNVISELLQPFVMLRRLFPDFLLPFDRKFQLAPDHLPHRTVRHIGPQWFLKRFVQNCYQRCRKV